MNVHSGGAFFLALLLTCMGLRFYLTSYSSSFPTELISSLFSRVESSIECTTTDDCKNYPETPICDLISHLNRKGYCQQCVNDNHCPNFPYEECSPHTKKCREPSVTKSPAIETAQFGYDLYNADPFYRLSDKSAGSEIDPGEKRMKLFNQRWTKDGDTKTMHGVSYNEPEDYTLALVSTCFSTSRSGSITSFESYKEDMSAALTVSGSGSSSGVSGDASIGVSSYESVYKSANEHKTSVNSQSLCKRYSFQMLDSYKLHLTSDAEDKIKKLPANWDGNGGKWDIFFQTYGTHIVKGGYIGSMKRASYTFTSSDREELVMEGESLSTSVNIGVPGVFTVGGDTSSERAREAAKRLRETSGFKVEVTRGDMIDFLDSVIVERSLSSFCEYLDYNEIRNFDESKCFRNTELYCIKVLNEAGFHNVGNKCAIPEDNTFDCVLDSDCSGSKRCWDMKCTDPTPCPKNTLVPLKCIENPPVTSINSFGSKCEYVKPQNEGMLPKVLYTRKGDGAGCKGYMTQDPEVKVKFCGGKDIRFCF